MRIITWNVNWARPDGYRGELIKKVISELEPEVVCITEGNKEIFSEGYSIFSDADYGYESPAYRRKVILWSKNPWKGIDTLGDDELPGGRFLSGTTMTSIGEVKFIGVCIPWREAHVKSGRKDRKGWEDHESYLKGLKRILNKEAQSPLILLGDFNQRLPRPKKNGQTIRIYKLLMDAIPDTLEIATAGLCNQLNDHITHTRDLQAEKISLINKSHPDFPESGKLSDHYGVVLDLVGK